MKTIKLNGWLAASALFLGMASCQSDEALQNPAEQGNDVFGTGSKVVTLSLNADGTTSSRAISDGQKAKKIIFEVYDLGKDADDAALTAEIPATVTPYIPMSTMTIKEYPTNIKLAVEDGHSYRIAIWAQNDFAENDPFDVKGKPLNVTVDYGVSNETNNDLRDAFCATKTFTYNDGGTSTFNVVLHRPFAQINVGTTMADYNNYSLEEGHIYPHRTIVASKITVSNVCNQLDIANDKILGDATNKAEFTLAYAPFKTTLDAGSEEYLTVKLNKPALNSITWATDKNVSAVDGFFPSKGEYPTILTASKHTDIVLNSEAATQEVYYLTEQFRYLTMCYVLVPFTKAEGTTFGEHQSGFAEDVYYSSTVGPVEVYFDEKANSSTPIKYFELSTIPVHRNWRTNLLGGLAEPNDPGNPDDPSSLFYNAKICVNVCPIYWGEYYNPNGQSASQTTWQTNEFPTSTPDNRHEELNPTQND